MTTDDEAGVRPGGHALGPHIVGQRVVVRFLLPGGSATDALGVCTAWGEEACVVETSRGPVTVPLAAILTGKPVPPRASVRHRVSVRDAELHTASLSPGLVVEPLGEWQLRFEPAPAGRVRKRFNSCLALGSGGSPDRVVEFYESRGREPLLHVELGTSYDGWEPVPGGDAHFQIASIAQVLRSVGPAGERPDGVRGEAVLDGDWLGLHGLYVEPERRRQGLARALLAVLLERGAERGATTAWLHVETDNAPALALYESLGFRTHHTMAFLRPRTN